MNDIELYISIIDNNEADRILKCMGQNLKKNNIPFKNKIIMVRRSLRNPNVMGINNKKHKQSPFNFILQKHLIKKDENMEEKEFFFHLIELDNIKSYEKLANMIWYCPDILEKHRDKIITNIKEGKNVFELDINFDSDGEVAKYIEKGSILFKDDIEDIIQYLCEIFQISKELKGDKEFEQTFEEIKNMDLKDFRTRLLKKKIKVEKYLAKFIFIITHKEEKIQLLRIMSIEAVIEFIKFRENEFKYKENEYSNKIKYKDKCLQEYEKDKDKILDKIEKLNKEKNKILINKDKEIDNYKKKYKNERDNLKKQLAQLENELINIREYINKFNDYMETFKNQKDKLFGVIVTMEIKITQNIYPEIYFVNYTKFMEKRDILKKLNKIYIQREGLSNRNLDKIENFAQENAIVSNIESFRDEKELIEKIALLKCRRI